MKLVHRNDKDRIIYVNQECNTTKELLMKALSEGIDLTGVDLRGADLRGMYLKGVRLRHANLSNTDLEGTVLIYADLYGTNFEGANLSYANFSDANLHSAWLRGANLNNAYLCNCLGNMEEIKTLQLDRWPISYTSTHLQIGCKRYPINHWFEFLDCTIEEMAHDALDWWKRNKDYIKKTIEMFPATKHGGDES